MLLELLIFLIIAIIIYKLPLNSVATALIVGIILAQFINIDSSHQSIELIQSYLLIIAISFFLIHSNYQTLFTKYLKLLIIFLISVIGSIIGFIIVINLFDNYDTALVSLSTYIGGSVNLLATAQITKLPSNELSQILVVDSVLTAIYLIILSLLSKKFQKSNKQIVKYEHISKQVLILLIYSIFICISIYLINNYLETSTNILNLIINKYTLIIIISLIIINVFKNIFTQVKINYPIGEVLLIMFFLTIGIDAKIADIFDKSIIPILLTCLIIITSNVVFTYIIGKILHYDLLSIFTASNAAIGGPTTAFSYVQSFRSNDLAIGALIIGSQGYVISFILINILTLK